MAVRWGSYRLFCNIRFRQDVRHVLPSILASEQQEALAAELNPVFSFPYGIFL